MRRRAFLRGVAASLAALPLASLPGCGGSGATLDAEHGAVLTAYFGADQLEHARAIGERYVASLGRDGAIEAALRPTLDLLVTSPDTDDAVAALEDAVGQDFAARAFHDLDGWILSPTELNLCALVHDAMA